MFVFFSWDLKFTGGGLVSTGGFATGPGTTFLSGVLKTVALLGCCRGLGSDWSIGLDFVALRPKGGAFSGSCSACSGLDLALRLWKSSVTSWAAGVEDSSGGGSGDEGGRGGVAASISWTN